MNRKVQFILAWRQYRVGDVIEPGAMLRGWLIFHRYCKPYEAPQPALTQAPARGRKAAHA